MPVRTLTERMRRGQGFQPSPPPTPQMPPSQLYNLALAQARALRTRSLLRGERHMRKMVRHRQLRFQEVGQQNLIDLAAVRQVLKERGVHLPEMPVL